MVTPSAARCCCASDGVERRNATRAMTMDERRAMKGPPAGPILRIAPLRYTRAVAMPPDSLPPDVVEALKLGKPIEAIKRLRKSTGVGLAEAKALVDAFSAGNTAYQRPGRKSRKRPEADVAA